MRGPYKIQSLETLCQRGVLVNTILDVGILTGTEELVRVFSDKKHILFEPVVEFNSDIEANYKHVDYELHNVAVSSVSGETRLTVRSEIAEGVISHSSISGDEPGESTRSVPVTTLDDFLIVHPQQGPFLLKIDIDGLELEVLKGAKNTLSMCDVVMIEADRASIADRISFLIGSGFVIFDIVEPAYYDGAFWQCDIIFVRNEALRIMFDQLGDGLDIDKYTVFR